MIYEHTYVNGMKFYWTPKSDGSIYIYCTSPSPSFRLSRFHQKFGSRHTHDVNW